MLRTVLGLFAYHSLCEQICKRLSRFQFAKISHSKGHQTDLFFIDDGVYWADSGRDFDIKTTTGDCPNDYLPYLVEHQVPIGV